MVIFDKAYLHESVSYTDTNETNGKSWRQKEKKICAKQKGERKPEENKTDAQIVIFPLLMNYIEV